jgi:hypothetical protein
MVETNMRLMAMKLALMVFALLLCGCNAAKQTDPQPLLAVNLTHGTRVMQ